MEKFNPLEQEVIKWIVNQPIAAMTNFDKVLQYKFFCDTYKLAFSYGKVGNEEKAIIFIKKCDEDMMKICLSQFFQVVSLLNRLRREGFINLLLENVTASQDFFCVIHKEWTTSKLNNNIMTLNQEGVFFDANDWNIRDKNGIIIYTTLALPYEYYTWALQYLQNAIYPTEDLSKLIERNFVTENEEALQIARDSLKETQNSLVLANKSLDATQKSLRWTRFAFGVSVVALLIGALSYQWSTSTITSEQFDIMEKRNDKLIESIQNNTKVICNKLDSVNRNTSSDMTKNDHKIKQ